MLHYKMAFASLSPARLMTTQPQPRMIRIDFLLFEGEVLRGVRVPMEGIEGLHKFRERDALYGHI